MVDQQPVDDVGSGEFVSHAVLDGVDVMGVPLPGEQRRLAENAAGAHEPERPLYALGAGGRHLDDALADQEDAGYVIAGPLDAGLALPEHLASEMQGLLPHRLILELHPWHDGRRRRGSSLGFCHSVGSELGQTVPIRVEAGSTVEMDQVQ